MIHSYLVDKLNEDMADVIMKIHCKLCFNDVIAELSKQPKIYTCTYKCVNCKDYINDDELVKYYDFWVLKPNMIYDCRVNMVMFCNECENLLHELDSDDGDEFD